jgi:hypothetical protein
VLHTYELHDSDHDELLKCIHFIPMRKLEGMIQFLSSDSYVEFHDRIK